MNNPVAQPEWMVCGMCGHRFNPDEHGACGACPLAPGCQLVCCPACGFETVNPQRSTWARNAQKASQALQAFSRSFQAARRP